MKYLIIYQQNMKKKKWKCTIEFKEDRNVITTLNQNYY